MKLSTTEFFDLVSEENKYTLFASFAKKNLEVAKEYIVYIKKNNNAEELIKVFNQFFSSSTISQENFDELLPIIKKEIKAALIHSTNTSVIHESSINYFQKTEGFNFVMEVAPELINYKNLLRKLVSTTYDFLNTQSREEKRSTLFTIDESNYDSFKNLLFYENRFLVNNILFIELITRNNYTFELLEDIKKNKALYAAFNHILRGDEKREKVELDTFFINLMKNPFISKEQCEEIIKETESTQKNTIDFLQDEDDVILFNPSSNDIPKTELDFQKYEILIQKLNYQMNINEFYDFLDHKIEDVPYIIKALKITKSTQFFSINDMIEYSHELIKEGYFKEENIPILIELINLSDHNIKDESKLLNHFLSKLKKEASHLIRNGSFQQVEMDQYIINFEKSMLDTTLQDSQITTKKIKI